MGNSSVSRADDEKNETNQEECKDDDLKGKPHLKSSIRSQASHVLQFACVSEC